MNTPLNFDSPPLIIVETIIQAETINYGGESWYLYSRLDPQVSFQVGLTVIHLIQGEKFFLIHTSQTNAECQSYFSVEQTIIIKLLKISNG